MSHAAGASPRAQLAVLDALRATADPANDISQASDRQLSELSGYSARTVGYALRDLRACERIVVWYTDERQRAVKLT